MFKKTLISEFFTTVSFSQAIQSFWYLTYKLPVLRKWNNNEILKNQLLSYLWLEKSKIIDFYNWRSAIFHALKIIWVKKTDEVLVTGYNCISVSNAVIQTWSKIKYVDINKNNFWIDFKELEKNISDKTKVIIIQHTFWKPANIEKITSLAKEKWILIIEDCAHSLWTKINKKHTWTFWDFAIFSTWRDKVISSVTWGFLVINNSEYFKKIKKIESKLVLPSRLLTIRNHLYNIEWYEAYKFYDFFKLWKIVIFLARKCKLITEILDKSEKNCNFKNFNYKLPNSLAGLALNELSKLKEYNNHRRNIADFYNEEIENKNIKIAFKKLKSEKNNYFRFPVLLKNIDEKNSFYNYMRKNKVLLWNSWTWVNIAPIWSNLDKANYALWSCKNAEDISSRILTLPNHKNITTDDAVWIVTLINNYKND